MDQEFKGSLDKDNKLILIVHKQLHQFTAKYPDNFYIG